MDILFVTPSANGSDSNMDMKQVQYLRRVYRIKKLPVHKRLSLGHLRRRLFSSEKRKNL